MIARRSLLIVLNNVVGAILGYVALVFITKFPASSFGAYAWALSALGMVAVLTNLGFGQAHIKRVSEGVDEPSATSTFFGTKMVLTFAFAGLVALALWVWTGLLGKGFTDATTEPVFVVVAIAFVLLSVRQFFDSVFQSHRHTARGESVLLVDTLVSVAGIMLAWDVFAHSHGRPTLFGGATAGAADRLGIQAPLDAASGGLLIAAAYLTGKAVSLLYAGVQFLVHRYPVGRPSLRVARSYWEFGFPLAVVSGIGILYANVDRVYLGIFWEAENVARFEVAFRILTPLLIVSTAVATLLFPTISQLHARGDHSLIRTQTRSAERYLSMILIPQLMLAFVFAPQGINLFDAKYVDQAPLVRILCLFVFFTVLVTPARSVLLGTGRPRALLRLGVINFLVVVLLGLVVIPRQGLGLRESGAALVAVLGSIVSYVYVKWKTREWTGNDYLTPDLFRQFAAGLLLGLALWGARAVLGADAFTRIWQLVLVAVLAVPAYVVILSALRGFHRSDLHFALDLINPRKLVGYVGGELVRQSKP